MKTTLVFLASLSAVAADDLARRDQGRMQGTWVVVACHVGKNELTNPDGAHLQTIAGDTMVNTRNGIRASQGVTFTLDATKEPRQFDFLSKGHGLGDQVYKGIYKFDGDRLLICYGGAVRPTRFDAEEHAEAPFNVLYVLERNKDDARPAEKARAGDVSYPRGGPDRAGAFPRASLPETPATLWVDDLGDSASTPVVAGDRLVVGNREGHVLALGLKDGAKIWDVVENGWGVMLAPVVAGDRVLLSTDGGLSARALADGSEVWRYPVAGGTLSSSPLVVSGMAIAGGSDGFVHAVDVKTGRVRWRADIVKDRPKDPEGFDGAKARIGDQPARPQTAASDGTSVFITIFDQSRVVALDLKTGEPRWSYQSKGWVSGGPTVGAGKVFFGSQDNKIYAVEADSGKLAWAFETRWRADGELAFCEGSVFACASDGRCYRLDAKDGRKVWEYETEVGPDGKHFFLSGSPLVDATAVYFGSWDGYLYALRREDGTRKWRHKPSVSGEHVGAAITDGNRLYVTLSPQFDYEKQRDKEGVHGIAAIGEAKP